MPVVSKGEGEGGGGDGLAVNSGSERGELV